MYATVDWKAMCGLCSSEVTPPPLHMYYDVGGMVRYGSSIQDPHTTTRGINYYIDRKVHVPNNPEKEGEIVVAVELEITRFSLVTLSYQMILNTSSRN